MQTTFKRGHKFDILDMFTISPSEVQELFWKEFESKVDKKKPNLDNLKVMLDSGLVDVNAKRNNDWTPLHSAAYWNSLKVAELLISSGAELEAKDNYDQMPLHLAAINNSLEVAKLLISSGVDLNAKGYNSRTPLDWAARNNRLEVAKLLFKHSSKKNRENVLNRYRNVHSHKTLVKSLEKLKV